MAGKVGPYPTVLHDKLRCSPDITRIFTLSTMSDLQILEWGGSTQKTICQLCQLVVAEIPWEFRHQTGVRGYTLHMLTKTRLATSEIAVLIITYRTQSTNCSVKQDNDHMNVLSKRPWALGSHCPLDSGAYTEKLFLRTCVPWTCKYTSEPSSIIKNRGLALRRWVLTRDTRQQANTDVYINPALLQLWLVHKLFLPVMHKSKVWILSI